MQPLKSQVATNASKASNKPPPREILKEKSVNKNVVPNTRSENNLQSTTTVAADSPESLNLDDVEIPLPQQWSKSEEQGMKDLDMFARQRFLCGLNNQKINGPVNLAFPKMHKSHNFFRIAQKKVQNLYKTWKHRILRSAKLWIGRFIKKEKDRNPAFEQTSHSFKDLKAAVNKHFRVHHLTSIFAFAKEAVDVSDCTKKGVMFLRCKRCTEAGFVRSTGSLKA
jgi:hypothetical protein